MRKVFLVVLLVSSLYGKLRSQQNWDRPMQLKNCFIDIKADMFTATTFIEFEFCNPNKQEIEGLFRFTLKPGQVITGFQLDLNGRYRDGSIEEKWKATNAYNTIVGKRIDPALLTMESMDQYSLRIYPVPANGCRKVTITIQQALKPVKNDLLYLLPLNINDTVRNFHLEISVNGTKPVALSGLIADRDFAGQHSSHHLSWNTGNIQLKKGISFSIPVSTDPIYCSKTLPGAKHFALRIHPSQNIDYDLHPKKLAVFWDASASAGKRDIGREISFLKQFISYHNIEELVIIPFNSKMLDTAILYTKNNFNSRWDHYLQSIDYDGATQLGNIDLAGIPADLYMIFSDGNNTYGRAVPKTGNRIVHCVYFSNTANTDALRQISGSGGGRLIDLERSSISTAIADASKAETWLVKISSSSGKVIVEQSLPLRRSQSLLINGTMPTGEDSLILHYGNNSNIHYVEHYALNARSECSSSAIDRLTMLTNYDRITKSYNWSSIIDFGLAEKVVTQNTAYIVLERIEDYVKYNIAPPKELEEECEKMNYVKRDTRFDRIKVQESGEFDIVRNVVATYNAQARSLASDAKLIDLERTRFEAESGIDSSASGAMVSEQPQSGAAIRAEETGLANVNGMSEVVVTAFGTSRSKSMGFSTTFYAQDFMKSATTVEQVLQGRVPGLLVTPSQPDLLTGAISLRGISSINGNNQPLYVLDGVPVYGNINNIISIHDIENISVVREGAAAALYGSRASNGAIVITSRKGRNHWNSYNHRPYRLKDMEDMDYILALKEVAVKNKLNEYERLKADYGGAPGFYFDVAEHFFETGLTSEAVKILLNAAEAANGGQPVQLAIAYTLESWKKWEEAILIYEQLILDNPGNLKFRQDMAWLQYQSGNYQAAVDGLYNAIKMPTGQMENMNRQLKATMLQDMNSMIALHWDQLDLRGIPASLIQPVDADLRIVMECNKGYLYFGLREPGNDQTYLYSTRTKNGGLYSNNYYWNYSSPADYQVKTSPTGKYRISVNYFSGYTSYGIPTMVRIKTFKNYGRSNQSISVENHILDNQNGTIEIAEVKW